LVTREKEKRKTNKRKGVYSLTKTTPLTSALSALDNSGGGESNITIGEFKEEHFLAKTSAHALPSRRM
jgi:hypothetical protein